MARHAEAKRAGDGLVRVGAAVFVLGVAAIAVMFVPFVADLVRHGARYAQDKHEYGLALNLATFLTCVGMALALAGLVRQAHESRARARPVFRDLDEVRQRTSAQTSSRSRFLAHRARARGDR